jgi:hypothetical protein
VGPVLPTFSILILVACGDQRKLERWGFEVDARGGAVPPVRVVAPIYVTAPSPFGPGTIDQYADGNVHTNARLSRHPDGFTRRQWYRFEYAWFTWALHEISIFNQETRGTLCLRPHCAGLPRLQRFQERLQRSWDDCVLHIRCDLPGATPVPKYRHNTGAVRRLNADPQLAVEGEPLPFQTPLGALSYPMGGGFLTYNNWCRSREKVSLMLEPRGRVSRRTRRMARDLIEKGAEHEEGHVEIARRMKSAFPGDCGPAMRRAADNRNAFYDPCSMFHPVSWCLDHLPSIDPPYLYLNDPE